MIFVTVGTQLPFDRLIKSIDLLAPNLKQSVVAQTGAGNYNCLNITQKDKIHPQELDEYIQNCNLIISHAGIGTVLNAQRFRKPIILVPRLARHGEHRNDHQIATCKMLENRPGIRIAYDPEKLTPDLINGINSAWPASQQNRNSASLTGYLRNTFERWDNNG